MRSEDTPAAPRLPILWIYIVFQVKKRQSQSYKFKEFAKTSIWEFWKKNKGDTLSAVAW